MLFRYIAFDWVDMGTMVNYSSQWCILPSLDGAKQTCHGEKG